MHNMKNKILKNRNLRNHPLVFTLSIPNSAKNNCFVHCCKFWQILPDWAIGIN